MYRFALILMVLTLMTGGALAQTTDLLISEYIEGSSNNKAVEIYNGSGDLINLGEYSLLLYANGASTPTQTMALDAVSMDTGDTFVLVNSNAEAALLGYADQQTSALTFNGDDALVLMKSDEVIDSIGTVGFDPGDGWSCADGSTVNQTLRRKTEICNGDTNTGDDFDVCLEWDFFVVDTFDNLGQHTSDCFSVADNWDSWGSLKAIYR
jgi:uncharacterized protein